MTLHMNEHAVNRWLYLNALYQPANKKQLQMKPKPELTQSTYSLWVYGLMF